MILNSQNIKEVRFECDFLGKKHGRNLLRNTFLTVSTHGIRFAACANKLATAARMPLYVICHCVEIFSKIEKKGLTL
jgi:hypothetical protein